MADNWQLKAILSAVDNLSPVLKQVSTVAKNTRKYLSDVASAANKLTSKIGLPLTVLSGVLGGFSLAAIKNAVVGFGEMGDAVYKGALRTGMGIGQYQRMKYVAEQAGVGVDMLEGAMGKLNLNMGNAAAGKNNNVTALFKQLGINARDANGSLRDGVDVLPQLADAFQQSKSPIEQARMGMLLFGKKWQEIAPMLMQGGAGIAETLERMKRFKGVMSDDDVKGARDWARTMRDLDFVTKGFQMTIAKNLVPIIKPMVESFENWAAVNKKLVGQKVGEMAKDLAEWLKTINFKSVVDGVESFAAGLGKLVDHIGGTKNAMIALVVIMNVQTIAAFAGLIGSVWRLTASLGGLALGMLAPVAPLQTLTTGMSVAQMRAATLTNTVGRLSAAFGVLGAAYAGWGIGTLLNDYVINPSVEKMTGKKGETLGGWIYDKIHPETTGPAPSLIGQQASGRVDGQVNISIAGLPPGSRVEKIASGGNMPLNLSAGYRSDALGLP